MYVIVWILFGAVVGWIASIIMGTNRQQGAIVTIIVGIVGSIFGGMLGHMLGIDTGAAFSLLGLLFAIIGAVALIGVIQLFNRA